MNLNFKLKTKKELINILHLLKKKYFFLTIFKKDNILKKKIKNLISLIYLNLAKKNE